MAAYTPTIGLEIHAELKTRTKMFCSSKNDADETRANVNICPICMAHPGTLPVINGEAVKHVLKVGIALGATLADYTEFDRKNYFYPDLPKGYQLSQFEYPLVAGGVLHDVAITRVHLEEDTASSIHDEHSGATLVDYNRAGVPLMELVTEPVITSAAQAGAFARELQLLLRYLDVSNANMEKGEMRVEANVSVGTGGKLGTKVEIKNLNSFRAMERAVDYEIKRQSQLLESGGAVIQETRGWDDAKQTTFSQRIKEGSADYRYFPDPDLPSLKLSEIPDLARATLEAQMPELPGARRARYVALAIPAEDAEAYLRDPQLGNFFDEAVEGANAEFVRLANNYIANDLVKIIRDTESQETETKAVLPISAPRFRKIISLILEKKLSSRAAKDLIVMATTEPGDPEVIAKDRGLLQTMDSGALEGVVQAVIAEHPSVAADFKAGKGAALEFLLGQSMKQLRGAGDPLVLRELLKKNLS